MVELSTKKTSEHQVPAWFVIVALGIFLMLLGLLSSRLIYRQPVNIQVNPIPRVTELLHLDTPTSKFILRSSLPVLEQTVEEDDPFTAVQMDWVGLYWRLVANLKDSTPLEIMRTQLPILALTKIKPISIKAPPSIPVTQSPLVTTPPQTEDPVNISNNPPAQSTEDPLVYIYHTHTSESYIPESGKDHTLNQKGDIVKVGSYLQQVLEEKYHISCAHSDTIHDQVPFRDSYKRSQVTVVNYLKEHPKTQVVIDLHRDATPGLANTCTINGVKCATIVIVAGSDKMGLPHPHWRTNLEFDQRLNDAMNFYYPGLSNGIIPSEARYNQHLHTHATLVEFGDQNNSLAEVYHAADLFAAILANIIAKDPTSGKTTINDL